MKNKTMIFAIIAITLLTIELFSFKFDEVLATTIIKDNIKSVDINDCENLILTLDEKECNSNFDDILSNNEKEIIKEYKIENTYSNDFKINIFIENDNKEYFDISYILDKDILKSSESTKLILIIRLKKHVIEEEKINYKVSVIAESII